MVYQSAQSQVRTFGEYAAACSYLEKSEKNSQLELRAHTFDFAPSGAVTTPPPTVGESQALKKARENLVIKQLLPCGVIAPRVLDAFLQIPRDRFIPGYEGSTIAYADASFPVGKGRVCMEPRVLGLLLQAANITKEKDVLLIGCGSGYEAAVASRIARHVTAVECHGELVRKAEDTLARLGCSNVRLIKVDKLTGRFWPSFAPYDVALINGAIEGDPPSHFASLLKQGDLMREGGVLLTVKREGEYLGKAMRYLNIRGKLYGRELELAQVPPLPEFTRPEGFRF